MTSLLGRDAVVPTSSTRARYLECDKNGFPIDRQVPRTIQSYSGTGGVGERIDYDGSNDLVIFADQLIGDLIVDLCPSIYSSFNLLGRELKIHINGFTTRDITLLSAPSFMKINSTSLTQQSHIIVGDGNSKTITLSFSSLNLWNLDYGASAVTAFPTTLPSVSFQSSTYLYGRFTGVSLPSVYIPDTETYDVILVDLTRETEGYLFPGLSTTSVTGPGQQNISFFYVPASRRTESTNVNGHLYKGPVYFGSFTIQMKPILTNVYEANFFTGTNTNGTLKSLRIGDGNVATIAVDGNGVPVNLGATPIAIATAIADAVYFYVLSATNTSIRYRSFASDIDSAFLGVNTLDAALWTPGETISDIEYDEKNKCLYVLPTNNLSLLLRICILPENGIAFPGVGRTGVFTSRQVNVAGGVALHSIAVCPYTSALYIAHSRLIGNRGIAIYQDFNSLSLSYLYTTPAATGDVVVGFTATGQLVIHYQNNLSVVTTSTRRPLTNAAGDLFTAFTLASFSASLSRTCYGWTRG